MPKHTSNKKLVHMHQTTLATLQLKLVHHYIVLAKDKIPKHTCQKTLAIITYNQHIIFSEVRIHTAPWHLPLSPQSFLSLNQQCSCPVLGHGSYKPKISNDWISISSSTSISFVASCIPSFLISCTPKIFSYLISSVLLGASTASLPTRISWSTR